MDTRAATKATGGSFTCFPATAERWADVQALFGPRGAVGGCWCMWWKASRSKWSAQRGEGNKATLQASVESGATPGLLAYADGVAVGWCAVEPREAYPALARSRILKPVDDQSVWSVTCFFIAKPYRRKGLTVQLLRAAVAHAREHGATILEGYPVEQKSSEMPAVYAFTGMASAFRQAGFTEMARRSETRPIMRYIIEQ